MKEPGIEDMKKLLKDVLPSVRDSELQRDLWPAMLQRLDQRTIRVPWWDWALLAALAGALCFLPGIIPALLYQL
jgi:hypothetical protein